MNTVSSGNRQRPLVKMTSLKTTSSSNSIISNGHNNRHERKVRFADALGLDLVSIFLSSCQYSILSNSPKNHTNNNHNNNNNINNNISTINNNHSNAKNNSNNLNYSNLSSIINYNNHYNNNNNYHPHNHHHAIQKQSSLPIMSSNVKNSPRKLFTFDHPQPVSLISFHERVKRNKVSLETCNVTNSAGNVSIICSVRVANISYEKSVIVRFTTNEWSTWTDSLASYIPESRDGWSDKFTSTFSVTNAVKQFLPGQRVIFAIRYSANNEVYWDNNNGANYTLRRSC